MSKYIRLIEWLKRSRLACLEQLLPVNCLLCNQSCSRPIAICACCQLLFARAEITRLEVSNKTALWQRFRCLSYYQSPVRELIRMGKFQDNCAALKALGLLFARSIQRGGYDQDRVLIPVPLHRDRLIERGYNQSLELALPIAHSLGLEIDNQCLVRIQAARPQHLSSRLERQKNTRALFQVRGRVPKRVAIIDDVFTTGATMRSVCSCLMDAGVESIEVWIIARTLKPSSGIIANHASYL